MIFLGIYSDSLSFPRNLLSGGIGSVFRYIHSLLAREKVENALFPPLLGSNFPELRSSMAVPCAVEDLDLFTSNFDFNFDTLYSVGTDKELSPNEFLVCLDRNYEDEKDFFNGLSEPSESVKPLSFPSSLGSYGDFKCEQYPDKVSPFNSEYSNSSSRKRKGDFDVFPSIASSISNLPPGFKHPSSIESTGGMSSCMLTSHGSDSNFDSSPIVHYQSFSEVDHLFNDFVKGIARDHPVGIDQQNSGQFDHVAASSFAPQVESHQVPFPKKSKVELSRFECPHCTAKFKVKGYLTRHMKKHNTLKAFQCPFFEEPSSGSSTGTKCHPTGGFSRRDTYKTHLKALHFIYPPGTKSTDRHFSSGRCAGCFEFFENNVQWLQEHIDAGLCEGTVSVRKSNPSLSAGDSKARKNETNRTLSEDKIKKVESAFKLSL